MLEFPQKRERNVLTLFSTLIISSYLNFLISSKVFIVIVFALLHRIVLDRAILILPLSMSRCSFWGYRTGNNTTKCRNIQAIRMYAPYKKPAVNHTNQFKSQTLFFFPRLIVNLIFRKCRIRCSISTLFFLVDIS